MFQIVRKISHLDSEEIDIVPTITIFRKENDAKDHIKEHSANFNCVGIELTYKEISEPDAIEWLKERSFR